MAYNTGNPVGSRSPKDLLDNSENLDELVNSPTKESHPDRLGVDRKTWHGMEVEFDAAEADRAAEWAATLASAGYIGTGVDGAYEDYDTDGPLTIDAFNEIFTKDAEFYRAKPGTTLPYTTTGTWATDQVDFVAVGDAALRSELAAPGGARKVKDAVSKVATITELRALTGLVDGQVIYMTDHTSAGDGGGGEFVVVGDESGETDNNGTRLVIDGKVVDRINYDYPTPQMFGVSGDGVTLDTDSFSAAAAVGNVVLVPYSQDGYNVADTVVSGGSTFLFEGGAGQLSGSATPADLNAVFIDQGQIGGVPWASALRSSKIGIVAGAIRQDSTDRTKWNYISDSGHVPIGVSGAFATASGGGITISYDTTYSRVISFIAAPDETLANVMGVSVGGSVGLASTTLSASATFNGAFTVEWDGAAWVFANGTGQNIGPALNSYANGSLRIDHTYCRGIGVQVSPYTAGGAILNPYIPMIKAAGNSYFDLQWMDPTTGSVVTGSESTRMKALVTKMNNLGLFLDGTNGATTINGTDIANGNIWFFGIFEK